MRREHGIFILTEKNGEYKEGFQGIILDETYDEKYVQIGIGECDNSTGEYHIFAFNTTIFIKQISPIENLKKLVQEFFEVKHPEEVEMGFPEIAITERLEKLLINH